MNLSERYTEEMSQADEALAYAQRMSDEALLLDTWDGESDCDLAERWDYEHGFSDLRETDAADALQMSYEDSLESTGDWWAMAEAAQDAGIDMRDEDDFEAWLSETYDPDWNGF